MWLWKTLERQTSRIPTELSLNLREGQPSEILEINHAAYIKRRYYQNPKYLSLCGQGNCPLDSKLKNKLFCGQCWKFKRFKYDPSSILLKCYWIFQDRDSLSLSLSRIYGNWGGLKKVNIVFIMSNWKRKMRKIQIWVKYPLKCLNANNGANV